MNKPNVLFIVLPYIVHNVDVNRPKVRSFLAFPYGLLSVATYNKDLANIKIIDCNTDPDYWGTIEYEMKTFKPGIVGFSMMFDNSYIHLKSLLHKVRSLDPHVLTVLGGAAASYSYEEILNEQPDLYAICYSEGELPFQHLLLYHNISWDLVHPSWITRKSLARGIEPEIEYVQNLDSVIDIDYSFVNPSAYDMQEAFSPFVDHNKKHKQFFIVTSRGCPFHCAFCSNGKIHGKKMRFASVDRIITHVQHLIYEYDMDVLTFYDDQILIDMPRAKLLFRSLAQFNLRIEMPNGLSPKFIDAEMAHLMKKAGVDTAYLAIESGSEYVLENLIHKPLKLSMVKPAVEWLRAEGIFCHGFFVMGMPGETDSHRKETYEFCKEINLDWNAFNMATPVRGSKLCDDCIKNGWIPKQKISEIVDKKYIINVPGTNPGQIEQDVYQMNLDLNFHNNYRMRIGDWKTAARCFEEVIRRYSGHKVAKCYLERCKERIERMNATETYIHDRHKQVRANIVDRDLNVNTERFTAELVRTNYTKNFTWMGIPILQYPTDLMVMQELIWQIKPDYIIETGIAFGGMLVFYASILEAIGHGRVLGIEIDPRENNMRILEKHSLGMRIGVCKGSSIDKKTVEIAKDFVRSGKVLVSLDSLHSHEHVLQELQLYSPLVSVGSYIVVMDTAIELYGHLDKNHDRPWGKGNNPWTAVQEFMKDNEEFVVDKEVEQRAGITAAPGGFLRRIK